MGIFDNVKSTFGGGQKGNGHSERNTSYTYASQSRPTAKPRSEKTSANGKDEETLKIGEEFKYLVRHLLEHNPGFRNEILAMLDEQGTLSEYFDAYRGKDLLTGMAYVYVTKNGTPYKSKKDAVAAGVSLLDLGTKPELWHIDKDGNPTVLATLEEQELYKEAQAAAEEEKIRAELKAEEERLRAELEAENAENGAD